MEQVHSKPRELSIEFTGNGSEYFGIWIVNILLTILTLGIYTAWAKVRTRKYFYNNTRMDGAIFDYHASPIAILKGWAIVVAALILQNLLNMFLPILGSAMFFLILVFIPWALVRSRVFNLLNTSYRNVRFYFQREYKEIYLISIIAALPFILGFGLLVSEIYGAQLRGETPDELTMGLLASPMLIGVLMFPYIMQRLYHFIISRSSFGKTRFNSESTIASFYAVYLKTLGLALVLMLVIVMLQQAAEATEPGMVKNILGYLLIFTSVVGAYYVIYYMETGILNEIWGKTSIDGNRFISRLEPWGFMWVVLSNTLLIVITLGIYIPWAEVRMTRYRLNNLALEVNGDMDNFIAKGHAEMGALGAELGDAMDFEISL